MSIQRAIVKDSTLNKIPKINLKDSKLLMLGPQDSLLQNLLEPEGGPEAGIRKYQ